MTRRVIIPAATPLRHVTTVRGVGVHWIEMGQGTPMVLLHGLCDSHRTWRKVAPLRARTRRVLMPDLPGHGMSDRLDATYEVEWYAEIMGAWLEALELDGIDLVGHSFGGGVAQALLPLHATRVRHLALVSAGGLGREVNLGLRLWSMTELAERVAQPFLSRGTRIGLSTLVRGIEPDEIDMLSWMNTMPGSARSLSRTVRGVIGWRGQKQQFLERMHEIEKLLALAIFWGEEDNVVPAHHADALTATLEGVTITRFRDVGHFPQLECPEALVAALETFVASTAPCRALVLARPSPTDDVDTRRLSAAPPHPDALRASAPPAIAEGRVSYASVPRSDGRASPVSGQLAALTVALSPSDAPRTSLAPVTLGKQMILRVWLALMACMLWWKGYVLATVRARGSSSGPDAR